MKEGAPEELQQEAHTDSLEGAFLYFARKGFVNEPHPGALLSYLSPVLRDRRTLVLMFLVPVLIMSLFTWLLRAKPEPFRAAIVVPEKSSEMVGFLLRELLTQNGRVKIVSGMSEKGIDAALKDGRIQAAIV